MAIACVSRMQDGGRGSITFEWSGWAVDDMFLKLFDFFFFCLFAVSWAAPEVPRLGVESEL